MIWDLKRESFHTFNLRRTPCSLGCHNGKPKQLELNFEIFTKCLCWKINIEKALLQIINMECTELIRMGEMMGYGIEGWPMKYLGLPLGGNPLLEYWNPDIEKIGILLLNCFELVGCEGRISIAAKYYPFALHCFSFLPFETLSSINSTVLQY